MNARQKRLSLLAAVVGSLAIALFLGAAERSAADTTGPACPANGKSICVTITDQANASYTTTSAGERYLFYEVTISNGDGTTTTNSNLVNLALTLTWDDLGASSTTSAFKTDVSGLCEPAGPSAPPRTLTCATPKSLGPGATQTYGPLIFVSAADLEATDATLTNATHTRLTANATAKEQDVAKKGKNPPTASVATDNSTPYEASIDEDVSWAGGGLSVTLQTAPRSQANVQQAKVPIHAGHGAEFATLTETACPAGETTCVGQKITVQVVGLTPANVQIFYTGPLPPGLTTNNLVVVHNGVSFTRACSGDFFQEPNDLATAGQCRRVSIDRSGPGDPRVIIDAWAPENGEWKWG